MPNYKDGMGNYKSNPLLTIVSKTSQTLISEDTTLNDDDHLKIVLKASTSYYGRVYLSLISPANADFKYDFKVISGTAIAQFEEVSTLPGGSFVFGDTQFLATDGNAQVHLLSFIVKTGTGGGTLQFQWCQNTSQVASTLLGETSNILLYELN